MLDRLILCRLWYRFWFLFWERWEIIEDLVFIFVILWKIILGLDKGDKSGIRSLVGSC